jgi:hypothetical protein
MRFYDLSDSPRGSHPGGDEILYGVQIGPKVHPSSCTLGTGSFPGAKRPVDVDHPLPLVSGCNLVGAIPSLSLYAGRVTFIFKAYQFEKINGLLEME